MTITNIVLQFGGQWMTNEDNNFEWRPQPTTKWQSILVDDATCTIEDVKDQIVKVLELKQDNLKLMLSYMPIISHRNPRPIYIKNECGLRAYFGFGGPEVRPLLHVGVEDDEDVIIVEDVTDSNDNQISAHDECDEPQPCEDRDSPVVNDDTHSFTDGSNLYIGQEFSSKEDVKKEVMSVAMKTSFDFHLLNSNKTTYIVRCANDKCTWRLRAARNKDSSVFSIRSYCNTHTCGASRRCGKRRHGSSSLVSSVILENFTGGKELPSIKTIVTMMQNRGVDVTYYKAWKGKKLALKALADKR